ncbi:MipA/OmpV family protein [Sphingomonas sp. ID1715]|uniref:MipA/OmpV family protein n=1 Tax=Sphingomonas sp. ID1715 TaxID=1656898 RepID=UPI001488D777|nr:MipA/OmpV family protein [Sphingomonas sp. ID1715]NNM75547.1 MipA/OmpV family protein [Sphingomonas sp. ID1715]
MRILILAPAAFALIATSAAAQQEGGRRVRVGVGAQLTPSYPGADEVSVGPFGDLSIARVGRTFTFEAPDESFGFSLLGRDGFGIGPAVSLQGSRKDKDVGVPIGKVKTTVEAGGFVQYQYRENWRLRAELRKGLGGHDGLIGDVSADFIMRDGDRYVFSIGPRVTITDKDYQRAYFGVTPAQSAATGLTSYSPGGGVQSVGGTAGLVYQFSDKWGAFGYARYDRLVGDAADSPLVRRYGSRDQFSGGLALTYTFVVR